MFFAPFLLLMTRRADTSNFQKKGTAVVDGEFKEISLDDYKGKWLVLFFWRELLSISFASLFSIAETLLSF
jgi:hypothetical protein